MTEDVSGEEREEFSCPVLWVQPNWGAKEGRNKVCPTVVAAGGFAARGGWATGGIEITLAPRHKGGKAQEGGRCGGFAPAQGRAE